MISIRSVVKRFVSVTAVDGVSLEVSPGEIHALLGPNGAGKTTLLRMLLGLMRPDSGEIRTGETRPLTPSEVGYLPEDRGLYPDVPVQRTLVYFGRLRGLSRPAATAAAEHWLRRLDLYERRGDLLRSLSKGNQQKVQFISAILHGPKLAVLDEPFSGLDPVNQDLFLTLFRDLRAQGTTILLSAHQMQLVERVADRIAVMHQGRIVLAGTLAEVRTGHVNAAGEPLSLHDVYVAAVGQAGDDEVAA